MRFKYAPSSRLSDDGLPWSTFRMTAPTIKNDSYFSRFQTKYKRRREGKTDYVQRRVLIQQDKTKYGAKKYRLVARITNGQVIAQIITATLDHDETICQANSRELKNYGITLGLTNYAAAYATGLLVARRLLKKLNLTEVFDAVKEEEEDARRPFKVILDVGLRRTTTGSRVFAVMKGAIDGGLFINHTDKRFPGKGKKKLTDQFIVGKHVADYMKKLQAEDAERYNRQFSRYIKAGITADKIEQLYRDAHKAIRENPDPKPKAESHYVPKVPQTPKTSRAEKRRNLNEKLVAKGLPPKPEITE